MELHKGIEAWEGDGRFSCTGRAVCREWDSTMREDLPLLIAAPKAALAFWPIEQPPGSGSVGAGD